MLVHVATIPGLVVTGEDTRLLSMGCEAKSTVLADVGVEQFPGSVAIGIVSDAKNIMINMSPECAGALGHALILAAGGK